ncbi:putative peptidoglycan glycosyltransferase FtsW [Bifidobacterium mongoliense]|uniref:peptidoglycan glycosyltransferase FtsW n=1 Tax=Bifidobacterium mongoliense TaxID=518643 RepID=UPI0030EF4EDE
MANSRKPSRSSGSAPRRTRTSRGGTGSGSDAKGGRKSGGSGSGRQVYPDADRFNSYTGIRALLNPIWCYHGFRIAVLALTCFGVVMVFSSSAVTMISQGSSPWKQALSQGGYCILGLILGWVASRVPHGTYQRYGFRFVCGSIVLQLLTITPLGVSVNGNAGWIGIPGVFTMQPAEIVKLALCIWMPSAMLVAVERYEQLGLKAYTKPVGVFVCTLGAVMVGKDLGTTMILVFIGVTSLLIGGFPGRWLSGVGAVLAVCIALFVIGSPNRMRRIMATYQPCTTDAQQDVCYQAIHAKFAMGSGGLLGVGIGNSREKWNYLPEAHNDFIYAIIGEETGFLGAVMVIALFAVLGWSLVCVALHMRHRYVSTVLVCITVWIVGQALVNIMVVVGLLPVMGIPMPFISAGGSSLIMCLVAAGVAASMMRAQPQIKAATATLGS